MLEELRYALKGWMVDVRDAGLVPETEYLNNIGEKSMYDYMRSDECPFDELAEAARLATSPGEVSVNAYVEYLKNDNSAIRYWGGGRVVD